MHSPLFRTFIPVLLLLLCIACTNEQSEPDPESKEEVPEAIRGLENVAVYAPDDFPDPDSVVLEEDLVITMTDYLYIDGFPSDIVIDDSGQIYVKAGVPGNAGIYIFDKDGNYLQNILQTGRGPGEVEAVASMAYRNDSLYLLDARLQKVVSYSTKTLETGKDRVLEKNPDMDDKALLSEMSAKEIFLANNGDPVLMYNSWSVTDSVKYSYFYTMNDDGVLGNRSNFRVRQTQFYPYEMEMQDKSNPPIPWPRPMPFGAQSYVRQDSEGNYYVIWTEELLIRIYNNDWEYQRAIYYDMPKYQMNLDEVDIDEKRKEFAEGEPIPEFWPVVQYFQIDDQNRFWVSTFTESDSLYKWYVLDTEGKMLGTFMQEGDRDENFTLSMSPLPKIKNGYYYDKHLNTDTWVSKVFRKKIRFVSEE